MHNAKFSSSAKWILSGEHSVVRGGKAIAFPLRNFSNSLTFEKGDALFIATNQEYWRKTIFSLLEMAAKFLRVSLKKISGHITLKSNIPLQAGLGSSAAICVNIANLFGHCGLCEDVLRLAKYLEDKFHGKSSGLDIAVVQADKPIIFQENKVVEFLKPSFWPPMILTYSGKRSITSICASVVNDIFLADEILALKLDKQMNLASCMCEDALKSSDFNKLKEGIMLGNEIFHRWGLCDASVSSLIKELLSAGAAAAKPIGSGLGGYILSLWEDSPEKYGDIYLTL
jgi:mevalonate kinase